MTNQVGGLTGALAEWRALLGDRRVSDEVDAAVRYGANAIGATRRIPAALRPGTREEVQELVRVAARWRVPLYPVSTGRNWGYGAANPVVDGCVVVDLSGMDRVVEFDRELGLVTVEPGVTQGGLAEFLEREGLPFLVPVHGGGPGCSLLGNAMERGYGITPHADHFGALTTLEAVLPDGSMYHGALASLGGGLVDRAFKWGVGPYLDGIFSQGGYGIVTRATFALAPVPEHLEVFFFTVPAEEGLERAVLAVREVQRRLPGLVGSTNLMNARRMLSMVAPYPSDRVPAGQTMPRELVASLAGGLQIGAWTGLGAIYGTRRTAAAARGAVKEALRGVASRSVFLSSTEASWASRVAGWLPEALRPREARYVGLLQGALQILGGRPSNVALRLAYWRGGRLPEGNTPLDPARDGCGILWYAPLVPMLPDRVRTYVGGVEATCLEHGIEPLITLTSLSDRCFDSTVPVLYDPADAAMADRARACYRALFEGGRAEGFVPYRAGIDSMGWYTGNGGPSWALAARIKRALDPHGIVAPGRYVPTEVAGGGGEGGGS